MKPIGFWNRLLISLLPSHVRDEHEREIADQLAREGGPTGPLAGLGRWLALGVDMARAAPPAHWDVLRRDLLVGWRGLRRAPGFTLSATAMLAIGIGGTVTVFGLVNGILLRPLPYPNAEQLVEVMEEHAERGFRRFGISPANFVDLTSDPAVFAATAAFQQRAATVRVADLPERVTTAAVTAGFFNVLAAPPLLGRVLGVDDDVPGATAVVASHSFWAGALGGDPNVIGRSIEFDGKLLRVVGVMGPSFQFPDLSISLWLPLAAGPEEWQRRGARYLTGVARLRSDVELAQANAAVNARAAALRGTYPETNKGWTAIVTDQREAIVGDARGPLRLALGAAGLVLIIALANVTNLMLARALTTQREAAIRTALGARSGRILRQRATEAIMLATLGSGAGLLLTHLATIAIVRLAGPALPRAEEVQFDGLVLGAVVALVVLTSVVLSVVPARLTVRDAPWRVLRREPTGSSAGQTRWQTGLVVAEVTLAVVVLVSAGLVVRTVTRLLDRPLGFDPTGAAVFRIEPPWRVDLSGSMDSVVARIEADRRRVAAQFDDLVDRLTTVPGIVHAGAVSRLPLTGQYWVTSIDRATAPAVTPDQRIATYVRPVTPTYFTAIGTPIVRGRGLAETDIRGAERVVVIDEALSRAAFGAANPIGEELLLDGPPGGARPRARVVGVAATVLMGGLEANPRPTFYISLAQADEGHSLNWGMDVVVRPASGRAVEAAVLGAARAMFPDAPVFGYRELDALAGASIAARRLHLIVLGTFAAVALALTSIGIAGLLLLVVRQRRRDLAVRLALGASPRSIWWTVERWALGVSALGAVLGLLLALMLARGFESLVFGVSVYDPLALAAGPVLGLGAAMVAAVIPAGQAASTRVIEALRNE